MCLNSEEPPAHFSKSVNGCEQKCTKLSALFYGTVSHCALLYYRVVHLVSSVDSENIEMEVSDWLLINQVWLAVTSAFGNMNQQSFSIHRLVGHI